MAEKPRRRVIEWETVAVTALPPGWFNVYKDEGKQLITPCPALLLQEARAVSDDPTGSVKTVHEPPYETRVVFADFESGELYPANDLGNYQTTTGPSETT